MKGTYVLKGFSAEYHFAWITKRKTFNRIISWCHLNIRLKGCYTPSASLGLQCLYNQGKRIISYYVAAPYLASKLRMFSVVFPLFLHWNLSHDLKDSERKVKSCLFDIAFFKSNIGQNSSGCFVVFGAHGRLSKNS